MTPSLTAARAAVARLYRTHCPADSNSLFRNAFSLTPATRQLPRHVLQLCHMSDWLAQINPSPGCRFTLNPVTDAAPSPRSTTAEARSTHEPPDHKHGIHTASVLGKAIAETQSSTVRRTDDSVAASHPPQQQQRNDLAATTTTRQQRTLSRVPCATNQSNSTAKRRHRHRNSVTTATRAKPPQQKKNSNQG